MIRNRDVVLLFPRFPHITGLLPTRPEPFATRCRARATLCLRYAPQTVSLQLSSTPHLASISRLLTYFSRFPLFGNRLIESHATALLIEGDDDASIEYLSRPKRDTDDGSSQPPTPIEERGRSTRRIGEPDGGGGGGAISPSSIGSTGTTGGGAAGFFRNASATGDRLFTMSGWRSPSTSMSRGRGSTSGTSTPSDSRAGSRSASRNR